jgi:hypothetical protein
MLYIYLRKSKIYERLKYHRSRGLVIDRLMDGSYCFRHRNAGYVTLDICQNFPNLMRRRPESRNGKANGVVYLRTVDLFRGTYNILDIRILTSLFLN